VSNLTREQINPLEDCLVQLQERWDHKLCFPLAELGKRYLRKDFGILIDCPTGQGPLGISNRFSLALLNDGTHCIDARARGNKDVRTCGNNCEFPMLVESIHVMDDTDRVVFSIAPSFVWLYALDEREDAGLGNSLYFSLVSGKFVFRTWLFPKDREFDVVFGFQSIFGAGKMPDDVVETGAQMMNDLPAQNGAIQRNNEILMVINGILPFLRIHIGYDWILARLEKSDDLVIEINDVLVGPF